VESVKRLHPSSPAGTLRLLVLTQLSVMKLRSRRRLQAYSLQLFVFGTALLFSVLPGRAALLDVWRADTLNLNDGDAVGTWSTVSNRFTANAAVGEQPVLKRNVTPAGGGVVRFNGSQRLTAPSPVGGKAAFSVALVFRAGAPGAG